MTRSDDTALPRTVDLDCPGAGAAVCERVVRLLPELRPVPREICTEVYGGPERIEVSGVVDDLPVRVEVTRLNGCEISRYDKLDAALGG